MDTDLLGAQGAYCTGQDGTERHSFSFWLGLQPTGLAYALVTLYWRSIVAKFSTIWSGLNGARFRILVSRRVCGDLLNGFSNEDRRDQGLRSASRRVSWARMASRFPFPVPNGWFAVAESGEVAPGEVKAIRSFARHLAIPEIEVCCEGLIRTVVTSWMRETPLGTFQTRLVRRSFGLGEENVHLRWSFTVSRNQHKLPGARQSCSPEEARPESAAS